MCREFVHVHKVPLTFLVADFVRLLRTISAPSHGVNHVQSKGARRRARDVLRGSRNASAGLLNG